MRRLLLLVALVAAGCGQKIVVVECDGSHLDDGAISPIMGDDGGPTPSPDGMIPPQPGPDGGPPPTPDSGAPGGNDAGIHNPTDGGPTNPDAGAVACSAAPYCVHDLTPAVAKANVRQPIMFTPMIDNPTGVALTFSVDKTEIVGHRRAALPAVQLADLDLSLVSDANGNVTFTVNDVPTWYATTTFTIRLHAKSATGPDVVAEGQVDVRGNLLFSGSSYVYAAASDGRPAHSVNFTQGQLINGSSFVSSPRQMLLARDGTLLVFDLGAQPPRIRRFMLTGENVQLSDFAYQDAMAHPYIPTDDGSRGLAQLMDGRVVLSVFEFGRTGGDSYLLVFHEDGSYDRTLTATDPTIEWSGVTASTTANEILVAEAVSNGRIVRLDPDTGAELGAFATSISSARSVIAVPGGNAYVGILGAILRITPQGGKQMVSMLGGDASDYWNYLAPYGDGRIVAGRDTYSDYANIVVINDTTGGGWLRPMNMGGAVVLPNGLAYLE